VKLVPILFFVNYFAEWKMSNLMVLIVAVKRDGIFAVLGCVSDILQIAMNPFCFLGGGGYECIQWLIFAQQNQDFDNVTNAINLLRTFEYVCEHFKITVRMQGLSQAPWIKSSNYVVRSYVSLSQRRQSMTD
jgi:hypothetical protein